MTGQGLVDSHEDNQRSRKHDIHRTDFRISLKEEKTKGHNNSSCSRNRLFQRQESSLYCFVIVGSQRIKIGARKSQKQPQSNCLMVRRVKFWEAVLAFCEM